MPTGAIYGVMNMLRRLDQDYPDAEVVVVFDPPGPTVRHDIFPDYKANRGKMPDDLSVQIAPLHRLIQKVIQYVSFLNKRQTMLLEHSHVCLLRTVQPSLFVPVIRILPSWLEMMWCFLIRCAISC